MDERSGSGGTGLAAEMFRTADRDGVVLVARLDAAVWQDDAATMTSKLTPPS